MAAMTPIRPCLNQAYVLNRVELSLFLFFSFSFFLSSRCFNRFLLGNLSRFAGFVLSFLHAFFEALNGTAEVFTHVLKFACTENQNNDKQHN